MEVLEIECQNDNCNSDTVVGQSQEMNMIFVSDLQVNKKFTCDNCNEVILVCDEQLMELLIGTYMNGNDYTNLANDFNQMAKHYETNNYLDELKEVINLAKGIADLFESNRDNFDYDTFVKKVNAGLKK